MILTSQLCSSVLKASNSLWMLQSTRSHITRYLPGWICQTEKVCTRQDYHTFKKVNGNKGMKHAELVSQILPYCCQSLFKASSKWDQHLSRGFCTDQREASEKSTDTENKIKHSDFTPIYRFPFIVHARMLSRFKVYHTAFTFTLIPLTLYLNSTGIISAQSVYVSVGFFTVAGIMLVIISSFIRKIVGTLYIDKKKETVKVSHLTFWSHRKDKFYNISDIIPLSDTNENFSDLFVILKTFQGDSYYLTMKYGQVLQKEDLMEVIGKLM